MIDGVEMNILIINMHDAYVKYQIKLYGSCVYQMGKVNEGHVQFYKVLIHSLLESIEGLGYKVTK